MRKQPSKISEAEIKKKQFTDEIDWEKPASEASKNSWRDDLWMIVFVRIFVADFFDLFLGHHGARICER